MSLSFVQPAASGARPLGSPPPAETCQLPQPTATRILALAAATTLLGELPPRPRRVRPTWRGLLSVLLAGLLLLLAALAAAPPPRPHLVAALPPVPPLATGAVPPVSPTPAPVVTAQSLGVLPWGVPTAAPPPLPSPPATAVPTARSAVPTPRPVAPHPAAVAPTATARPPAAPTSPPMATATPWWPDFTPAPTPVRGPITPTAGAGPWGNDWCQSCYDRSATIKGPGPTPAATP